MSLNPPGFECPSEMADAFQRFLDTAEQLTGIKLFDCNNPSGGGLIGVCVLASVKTGHTSVWSNVPEGVQRITLDQHLNRTQPALDGFIATQKPD